MKAYGSAVDAFAKSMRRSKTPMTQSMNNFTRRSQSLSVSLFAFLFSFTLLNLSSQMYYLRKEGRKCFI